MTNAAFIFMVNFPRAPLQRGELLVRSLSKTERATLVYLVSRIVIEDTQNRGIGLEDMAPEDAR